MDEQSAESDLDLLVSFDEPVNLFDAIRLERELESRLAGKWMSSQQDHSNRESANVLQRTALKSSK